MKLIRCLYVLTLVFVPLAAATSAPGAKKTGNVSVTTLLSGLDNPCGVAVQPGTGDVFVADSGALRVVRVHPNRPGTFDEVITGFPRDVYGKGPKYDIGPLGLAFLGKKRLIVGGGGLPDGSELLRVYDLTGGAKPLEASAMKFQLGPLVPSEQTIKGEGNFYGIAVSPNAIYVTCNGDDTKGWISKAHVSGTTPGQFEPFIATKVATEVDAPVGIAIDHRGHIVIGQMGEINKPQDSLLTFYSPTDGRMLWNLETSLFDIAALAYSPEQPSRLYALDFAWMDEKEGGLFRLDSVSDDGKNGVRAVKILALDKPTAMAFGSDGSLYVTLFGSASDQADSKPGKLVKIAGDL